MKVRPSRNVPVAKREIDDKKQDASQNHSKKPGTLVIRMNMHTLLHTTIV
jgi:hypothetical protein